jgi:hypothetical protein
MRSPINDSRPTKSRQRCSFSHPCAKAGWRRLPFSHLSVAREAAAATSVASLPGPGRSTDRPANSRRRRRAIFRATPLFPACRSCARVTGRPTAFSTPTSPARQLHSGQRVRLFNDRGSVGLVLRASDEVQPANLFVAGSAPTATRFRARSTCSAPTGTPISARAPPIRALGSILPLGRAACADERGGLPMLVMVEVAFVNLSADLARP